MSIIIVKVLTGVADISRVHYSEYSQFLSFELAA